MAAVLTAVTAAALGAQSVVHGRVLDDQSRSPVEMAELRLVDAEGEVQGRALTDEEGRFRIQLTSSGAYAVEVERVGYASLQAGGLDVVEDDELELQVLLAADAVALDPVTVVTERSEWGRLGEFRDRAERNQRYGRGRIWTGDALNRRGGIPVQMIVDEYSWGGRCEPTVMLNGLPVQGPLYGVGAEEVEGIELYRDYHTIPAEYYRSGMCGLALIWTEADSEDRAWSWTRIAAAGVIAVIIGVVLR